jgi:uncharacterized RDD family membrane protein YckC
MPRADKPDEPLLFDLPLDPPAERSRPPAAAERKRPLPKTPAPRAPEEVEESEAAQDEEDASEEQDETARGGTGAGSRIAAGAADLLVHAAVAVTLLVGTRMMGVRPGVQDWPAFSVFLLTFSFLYMVVPLAFWGQSLGMAWAGLVARNRDGEPLTFEQTARRWLGGLLTLGLAGLPFALTGAARSLTDRLSGSATFPSRGPA